MLVPGNNAIVGFDLNELKVSIFKLIKYSIVDYLPHPYCVHHAIPGKHHRKVSMDVVKLHIDVSPPTDVSVHRANDMMHHPCQLNTNMGLLDSCNVTSTVREHLDSDLLALIIFEKDFDTVGEAGVLDIWMEPDVFFVYVQNILRLREVMLDFFSQELGHVELPDSQHQV